MARGSRRRRRRLAWRDSHSPIEGEAPREAAREPRSEPDEPANMRESRLLIVRGGGGVAIGGGALTVGAARVSRSSALADESVRLT